MPSIKWICVIFIEFIRGAAYYALFVASVMLLLFLPPDATVDLFPRVVIMITMFSAAYNVERSSVVVSRSAKGPV
jgi:general L-amino acid transport system permease protein